MHNCILITAYTDIPYLFRLVENFDGNFDIYIHIDKKAEIKQSYIHALSIMKGVKKVDSVYSINWGGRNHVDAILWLCQEALTKSPNARFFHLISGNDIMVKSINYFVSFFESTYNNYISYFSLPCQQWIEGGLNRLIYKHPLDRLNIKDDKDYQVYQRFLRFQKNSNFKRKLPQFQLYGGSSWWSLSRIAIEYIIDNYNWKGWYNRLGDSFVSDEMYFQTLLMNSPLRESVCNDNLRYIQWTLKNGNIPAVLDETDIADIQKTNTMFARKVNSKISFKLINYYEQNT